MSVGIPCVLGGLSVELTLVHKNIKFMKCQLCSHMLLPNCLMLASAQGISTVTYYTIVHVPEQLSS